LTDYLLYKRVSGASESDPPAALDEALTGPSIGGGVQQFAKPYFSESERQDIVQRVDEKIREIGGGSWDTGKQVVLDRYYSYSKDDWTDVEKSTETAVHRSFHLFQNYPNPFNPVTTITYLLPVSGHVELAVFNLSGRRICTLVNGNRAAAKHQVQWDGKNGQGENVASGVYIYQLKTNGFIQSRRLLLLR
jgi:hypothetical protein